MKMVKRMKSRKTVDAYPYKKEKFIKFPTYQEACEYCEENGIDISLIHRRLGDYVVQDK